MEVINLGTNVSESVRLNENQSGFKVTLVGVVSSDFNGTWSVEYSPNNNSWLPHEDMTGLTGDKTGDLYFAVPWVRLRTEGANAGSVTLHVIQGA